MSDVFSEVIGHERVLRRLRAMLANEAVPHAVVFHGPRHAGKATVAEALAAALLAAQDASSHPDFRRVERPRDEKTDKLKKVIPIDSVRSLQHHVRMSAFLGGAKVALIDGAEHLSEEASNALLKTLEEPTKRAYVLLTVEDLTRLPRTILSRSALMRFDRVPDAVVADALLARGTAPFEAAKLAARADGRPGLAIGFVEQGDMVNWYETEERRWRSLRAAPPHRRLLECASLAPARADREETIERLRDVLDVWQGFLRRELKAGEPSAAANLRKLSALRSSLAVNVQPRLLLEKFALTLDR
ncbi:MAG: hypothetical protein QY323_02190 [Patescibacteria group bacterium]|nr:MAG: hypothetical protein QY323_02190 [Patescibacteria group bacterium]